MGGGMAGMGGMAGGMSGMCGGIGSTSITARAAETAGRNAERERAMRAPAMLRGGAAVT